MSTWNTCIGVGAFVASFLGTPTARAESTAAPPACCRCDPGRCAVDESGDHCATAGCAYCMDGCPAADNTTCCLGGTP